MGLMDFRKIPDVALPARLQDTALNATYAPASGSANYATPAAVTAAVAPKLDTAAAASTYAPQTTVIPKWKASTAYTAGDAVISPAGDIVSAVATFTSGATFSPVNWSYVRMNDYFVNVKSFGAKADGATNDTTAIHAARDYAATTGFVVYFPPSATTYRTDALIANKANQTWILSPGATIQPVTATATSIFQVTASNVTLTGGGTLDGSTTTNPSCAGIYSFSSSVTDLTVDNITIKSTGGYGIQSCSSRTRIRNCTLTSTGSTAINIGPATTDIVDCAIIGNVIDRSTASLSTIYGNVFVAGTSGGLKVLRTKIHHNISIMPASPTASAGNVIGIECHRGALYTSIVGNHTYNGCMGISVALGSDHTTVTGNVIFGPNWYGIELADASYCTVSNNTIDGNGVLGSGAANSTPAIVTNSSSGTANSYNSIVGNTISGLAAGGSNSSSGIGLAGGIGDVVSGNNIVATIHGIVSAGVNDVAISGNKILGTMASGSNAIWINNSIGGATVGVNNIKNFVNGINLTATSVTMDNVAIGSNTFVGVTNPSITSVSGSGALGSNIRWSGNVGSSVVNSVIPAAQIPDLSTTYATPAAVAASYVATSTKGAANGVATLDATGKVPAAQIASATGIPPWQPSTAYTAGQQVVSPNNDVVSAITGFTSGGSYVAANWTLSTSYAPPAPPFVAGRYYTADGDAGNATLTVGKLYFTPIWVPKVTTLTKVGIEVSTGVATAVVRLGFYADSNGNPGSLILDAGTIDASAVGAPVLTISQAVGPGLVWMAAASQTAGATVQILGGMSHWIGKFSPSNGGNLGAYTQTGVTAALPGTATPAATDFGLRQFIAV